MSIDEILNYIIGKFTTDVHTEYSTYPKEYLIFNLSIAILLTSIIFIILLIVIKNVYYGKKLVSSIDTTIIGTILGMFLMSIDNTIRTYSIYVSNGYSMLLGDQKAIIFSFGLWLTLYSQFRSSLNIIYIKENTRNSVKTILKYAFFFAFVLIITSFFTILSIIPSIGEDILLGLNGIIIVLSATIISIKLFLESRKDLYSKFKKWRLRFLFGAALVLTIDGYYITFYFLFSALNVLITNFPIINLIYPLYNFVWTHIGEVESFIIYVPYCLLSYLGIFFPLTLQKRLKIYTDTSQIQSKMVN